MEHEADALADDYCNAWQADHLEIPKTDQPAPSDDDDDTQQFFIKFKVEFIYPPAFTLEDDEDYVLVDFALESSTSIHQIWAPCKRSDPEILSWDEISTMLTRIKVPLHKQPSMLHRISTCASRMANADHNRSKQVLPMMVSIRILVDYSCYKQEDASTYVMRNKAEFAKLMPVPASNESVVGLKKEILEDKDNASVKHCMFCLENLQVGSEIMCMPCSHLYHHICILHWLRISNFCPICRFQLSA